MDSSRNAGQRLPAFSPPLLLLPFFPHFPPICSILFFNFFLLAHQTVVGVVVPIQHHRRINAQLSPATFGEERRQQAERPDALKQAWQELLELRANQSAYADREFPVDRRLLGSLRRCGSNPNTEAIPSSASMLSPKLIGIYAEVGHLTRICPERGRKEVDDADAMDLGELLEDFRQQCSLSLSAFPELPSLAQIFGTFGSPIDLAQSGAEHKDLQGWTREIVGQIESIPGHEERWKLLVIAPGLHDIPPGQSAHRLAQSVLQSVHIVRHRLPRRTFLLILRHSHFAFWHTLARASAFCAKVMEHWDWQEPELGEKAWEEVETRISVNFQSEDFHVEIADLMDVGRPLPGPDGLPDVSVLGPDCAHLSARGLSLLHAQLWNWLLQPRARSQPFVPLVRPLLCPRPHCPFLLTARNRLACPRLPPLLTSAGGSGRAGRDQQSSRAGTEAWAALSPLALLLASALLLYALLAGCSLMPSLSAGSSPRGANSPVQQSEPLMRLAS